MTADQNQQSESEMESKFSRETLDSASVNFFFFYSKKRNLNRSVEAEFSF